MSPIYSPKALSRRSVAGPRVALEPAPGAKRARRQTLHRVPYRNDGLDL